jgi:hypothetical protein
MIELPSWFLVVVGVAVFTAAHRRRRGVAFLHDADGGPVLTDAELSPSD